MKILAQGKLYDTSFATDLFTCSTLDYHKPRQGYCATLSYDPVLGFFLHCREVTTDGSGIATTIVSEQEGEIIPLTPLEVKQWVDSTGRDLVTSEVSATLKACIACLRAVEGKP
jgi:hypothetical protein